MKSSIPRTLSILAFITLVQIRTTGCGMMHHMMKKMMKKHHEDHEEKGLSLSFKPVAIPIPIPIAYVDKGHMPAQNPWAQESKPKGMMWEMMKMKMKWKMKMMKKAMKGMKGMKAKKCCPMAKKMGMKMKGWPMANPVMMCPQMMMMGCNMMPSMKGCNMKAAWPSMPAMCDDEDETEEEEEVEEEDWPEYYDRELEEDQNGWDTRALPVYTLPDMTTTHGMKRRGDNLDDTGSSLKERIAYVRVKRSSRISKASRKSFDYDFDYI